MISDGLKNPIPKNEIYSDEIKVSYLKKIDTIFNKGIYFYLDPKNLTRSLEDSVFFRKQSFNSHLNIGSKKIVTHFEEITHFSESYRSCCNRLIACFEYTIIS